MADETLTSALDALLAADNAAAVRSAADTAFGLTFPAAGTLATTADISTVTEVSITGTTTLDTTAFGKVHVCSGTSADYTVTLPAAASSSGKSIGFRMSDALTRFVTIDGNASETINGAANRILWSGETCILYCNGSNWFKTSGISKPLTASITREALQGSLATGTMTAVTFDTNKTDPSSRMATAPSITIKRAGLYRITASITLTKSDGTDGISANSARTLCDLRVNGSSIPGGDERSILAAAYGKVVGNAVATVAVGDAITAAVYHNTGATEAVYGVSSGDTTILSVEEIPQW